MILRMRETKECPFITWTRNKQKTATTRTHPLKVGSDYELASGSKYKPVKSGLWVRVSRVTEWTITSAATDIELQERILRVENIRKMPAAIAMTTHGQVWQFPTREQLWKFFIDLLREINKGKAIKGKPFGDDTPLYTNDYILIEPPTNHPNPESEITVEYLVPKKGWQDESFFYGPGLCTVAILRYRGRKVDVTANGDIRIEEMRKGKRGGPVNLSDFENDKDLKRIATEGDKAYQFCWIDNNWFEYWYNYKGAADGSDDDFIEGDTTYSYDDAIKSAKARLLDDDFWKDIEAEYAERHAAAKQKPAKTN